MNKHPAIGLYCIVRGKDSGVHAGIISSVTADTVTITDARRLWRWRAKESISLSAVAIHGLDPSRSRIAPQLPSIFLERRDISEFIQTSAAAEASIREAEDASQ